MDRWDGRLKEKWKGGREGGREGGQTNGKMGERNE
jgi:hypothetical protein